ncbi:MEKHLA domain-containing protein [Cohnella yongneupensis]|uniref:MEKHLA domain-containing protein n=1 Tax=Cohnella yongneupensis TaxID=425006 RepID=A0ABW0QYQ9_9BACL
MEEHGRLLLESYARVVGKSLLEYDPEKQSAIEALFHAPFVLLSHGTEADPILNFGNRQALTLWEMDWQSFTSMPSRLTAEPMERSERDKLLADAKRQGYADDIRGIRIASSGKRFEIVALLWNLVDEEGTYNGQAAMFKEWQFV